MRCATKEKTLLYSGSRILVRASKPTFIPNEVLDVHPRLAMDLDADGIDRPGELLQPLGATNKKHVVLVDPGDIQPPAG